MERRRPGRRWVVLVAAAWGWSAAVAAAQTPDQRPSPALSLALAKGAVQAGDVVRVTDVRGYTIEGPLAGFTAEIVRVKVREGVRGVAASDVRLMQRQQRDSLLNGLLIGAAVGAIPGIYWLVADPNECRGLCPEEYALIGIGAAVGGAIDHIVRRRVTVYAAGEKDPLKSVSIRPLVMRHRRGVRVAIRF